MRAGQERVRGGAYDPGTRRSMCKYVMGSVVLCCDRTVAKNTPLWRKMHVSRGFYLFVLFLIHERGSWVTKIEETLLQTNRSPWKCAGGGSSELEDLPYQEVMSCVL